MTYLPHCTICQTYTLATCASCDLPLCGPVCAVSHGLSAHGYGAFRRRYTINAISEQAKRRRHQMGAR